MAALDFPAAPTDGQLFSGPNGITYQWDATAGLWKSVGVGAPIVIVSDTPPTPVAQGQLWWNSVLGSLFISYNDGNTTQWVPASTAPPPTTAPTLQLYSEQTLLSTATSLAVAFPPSFKKLEVEFVVLNAAAADFSPYFHFMQGSTPVAAGYQQQILYGAAATATSQALATQPQVVMGATQWMRGTAHFGRQEGSNTWSCVMHEWLAQTSGGRVQYNTAFDCPAAGITGCRIISSTGAINFQVGSYMRCFAVT